MRSSSNQTLGDFTRTVSIRRRWKIHVRSTIYILHSNHYITTGKHQKDSTCKQSKIVYYLWCCKKIKQPGQARAIPRGVPSDRSEERNEGYGMSPLNLKDSDVINEGPGWSSSAMESKNIITSPNNIEGKVFIVRESRIYGGDNVTDVYESRGFEIRAAESAGLKECW